MMNGEAILGVLADNYHHVQKWDKQFQAYYLGFRDIASGESRFDDPRIKPWTETNGAESYWDLPDLKLEYLHGRGVKTRTFDLI
jgi:hypothetical protein